MFPRAVRPVKMTPNPIRSRPTPCAQSARVAAPFLNLSRGTLP